MPRYFLEVAYKGTRYSGFQVQENAITIQSEVEKAFNVIHGLKEGKLLDGGTLVDQVKFTGSSRTDAGVHALQNYFHFDFEAEVHPQLVYKMNAILPHDIVVKRLVGVSDTAHSRFDAISRRYVYKIHSFKDPFLHDRSFYFPYTLDYQLLDQTAAYITEQTNFWGFSKTNTQVKNFVCQVQESFWTLNGSELTYTIESNRFLRGMVRLLTAAQLKVARNRISYGQFQDFFNGVLKCPYSVPAHGLYLLQVTYPESLILDK
ncbi:MAG TPA: tRNA pseudouridine synthase A [Chitinophagaceae bacterium]